MRVNVRKVVLFITMTYSLTLLLTAGYFLAGGTSAPPGIILLGLAYMFVPGACAAFVQSVHGERVLAPLAVRFRFELDDELQKAYIERLRASTRAAGVASGAVRGRE
jgi:hypothetical protein